MILKKLWSIFFQFSNFKSFNPLPSSSFPDPFGFLFIGALKELVDFILLPYSYALTLIRTLIGFHYLSEF